MKISKSIGEGKGVGTHFVVLGSIYITLGEYDDAIDCFNQSLEIGKAKLATKGVKAFCTEISEIFTSVLRQWSRQKGY